MVRWVGIAVPTFPEEFHSVPLEGSTVMCTLFVKFSVLVQM
jgi:hypothetical protein